MDSAKNVAGLFQQNQYTPGMNLFSGAINIALVKSCVTAAAKPKNGGALVIVQMLLGG
jgi:hypothetical protein